jgi:hypothetical protein
MKQTYRYLWYPLFQAQWDIRVAANKEATELMVSFGKVEVITSKILWSPP